MTPAAPFIFLTILVFTQCDMETNTTLFETTLTTELIESSSFVELSTVASQNAAPPTNYFKTVQIPVEPKSPILETRTYLLNTSFPTYVSIPIVTFRTNEATLQIIDVASRDFNGRVSVQRLIVNPDQPNIFVSQILLTVPPNHQEILSSSELAVDYTFLGSYGTILLSPPFATGTLSLKRKEKGQVLVIGLGGGQLNNYLHYFFPELNITVVELQPVIGYIAQKYFGFKEDETQHLLIMDGLEYLNKAANNSQKFDAIYIDACPSVYPVGKEILCPRNEFLNTSTIKNINHVLADNGRTLTIKMLLVTNNVTDRAIKLSQPFRESFGNCLVLPMVSPNNKILICVGKNRKKLDLEKVWSEMMSFHSPQQ